MNEKEICKVSKLCGGCQYQGVEYSQQLQIKQDYVNRLFSRNKVSTIIGMENPYYYRNKAQVAFGQYRGKVLCGNYVTSTHQIVEVKNCMLVNETANKIISDVKKLAISFKLPIFDEDRFTGFLRHVLVRVGYASKQVMVVIVSGSYAFPKKRDFIKALLALHPEITTIVQNVNNRRTSMVLSNQSEVIYGKGYIIDSLCGKKFYISANSFYQVNSKQTEILYQKVIEFAQLNNSDIVIDSYCGIGTIGIIVADKVKKVFGVEINGEAIKDAKKNASINEINNIEFVASDAGKYMEKLANSKQHVDVVIMDPARAGADQKFLASLVRLKPQKIVYISCNPLTQRDNTAYLQKQGYTIKQIQPVDMFPMTEHVESVILLSKAQ